MKNRVKFYTINFVIVILVLACNTKINKTIGLHKKGLLYDKSTNELISNKIYSTGKYHIDENNDFILFDILQKQSQTIFYGFTKDESKIKFNVLYRFKPDETKLFELYTEYGTKFEKHILIPELKYAVRNVIKKIDNNKDLKLKLNEIEDISFSKLMEKLKDKYILLLKLKIKILN